MALWGGFNTLNYITGGKASQIYGKMNAQNGNIYLVNPSGVQIGNSAQINVGSLYVSNKSMTDADLNAFYNNAANTNYALGGTVTTAELMSLGHIEASSKVTFDGDRIIIDMDRLSAKDGLTAIGLGNAEGYDIVLGQTKETTPSATVTLYGQDEKGNRTSLDDKKADYTYTWVKDAKDLAAIANKLDGNYALRNAIDLTGGAFTPIGTEDNAFKGKLDGLGNNIFGLRIEGNSNYAGLFGYTDGAIMGYFNLISGSEKTDITGNQYVGSLIGYAKDTKVKGVTSTLDVEGTTDVGGLVGHAENSHFYNIINTGTVKGHENAGGLIGSMKGGTLGDGEDQTITDWETHNLGAVKGIDKGTITNPETDYSHNIGGLVGMSDGATIGSKDSKAVYNQAAVTGGYNVGGIVGSAEGIKLQNVANKSTVTAKGYTSFDYVFHTNYTGTYYNGKSNTKPYSNSNDRTRTVTVKAANAGGIAGSITGSTIETAENTGNVQSGEDAVYAQNYEKDVRYIGGNVGGIAGMAENTDIDNAKNRETNIRGAMNVGGIAGYFGNTTNAEKSYAIKNALNSGGDIMATGGLHFEGDGWAREITRRDYEEGNSEEYITGNIGGIAGYLSGDYVRIEKSGNRGTVHTDLTDRKKEIAQAANAGGIVGKIDRATMQTLDGIKQDKKTVTVSDSYNTGLVQGYVNIGGVAGFMYNGSITDSYNEGAIKANRNAVEEGGKKRPLNMGGIVGDTTELSQARAVLYNVFNKGTIGDQSYDTNGRHVGGIAGRLSGTVDTAYNNGAIWNGYSNVGGITGYWYDGQISNSFNTGNITVYNQDDGMESAVGGLVGSLDLSGGAKTLSNAYNLGAIRSFQGKRENAVAGIIGSVKLYGGAKTLSINNVYTTGNIYAADGQGKEQPNAKRHAIIGNITSGDSVDVNNAFYIKPADGNGYSKITTNDEKLNGTAIEYNERYDANAWKDLKNLATADKTTGINKNDPNWETGWRIYDKATLPMLNAFLPKSEGYFSGTDAKKDGIDTIQYGTAYNPLLTIITANKNAGTLTYDWSKLMDDTSSIAVYGAGLNFTDVSMNDGVGFYNGTIYSDGALNLTGKEPGSKDSTALQFGGLSQLYGDSVTINGNRQNIIINGKIQSLGTKERHDSDKVQSGDITITGAGSLDIYGKLFTSDAKKDVLIPGVGDELTDAVTGVVDKDKVSKKDEAMTDMGDRYGVKVNADDVKWNGDLTIDADSYVNINYGNLKSGETRVGGNISITSAKGDVFMDTDFTAGGTITMTGDKNLILDVSHLGGAKTNSDSGTAEAVQDFFREHQGNEKGVSFLKNKKEDGSQEYSDAYKIAIDMWENGEDNKPGAFNFTKFDDKNDQNKTLQSALKDFYVNGDTKNTGDKFVYVWLQSAEQLNGIQTYADHNKTNILSYNFAMKNDIDASSMGEGVYQSIGSNDKAFTGTFDGLGNRITGLTATNGGIFGTIGEGGRVKDVKIYSSQFSGTSAGAVAAKNEGTISGVTGLGNSVISGTENSSIGGLVGSNSGTIEAVTDQSSIIAQNSSVVSGGIAGTNSGTITNAETNSAVTSELANGQVSHMGGIAGKNSGTIGDEKYGVSAHGVTGKTGQAQTSGGIVGINEAKGNIINAYNETVLHGAKGLGGIAGTNEGTISNVTNAVEVAGDRNTHYTGGETGAGSTNVGGLVGNQISGTIENGRNTGTVIGDRNVGGLVGSNAIGSTLTNLENGDTASVTGYENVGGIAGVNAGTITAGADTDLINAGSVTGHIYVGGVAGTNNGTIANTKSEANLYVDDGRELLPGESKGQYFGGIAGKNSQDAIISNSTNKGTVTTSNVTYVGGISGINYGTLDTVHNEGDVEAGSASYVGGITGVNEAGAYLKGDVSNKGNVTGKENVGGIAGVNNSENLNGEEDKLLVYTNEGTVTGKEGSAGGIFNVNTGNLTYVELRNKGDVNGTGKENTGGLIGKNSGNISHSNLINETGATVTGSGNTGGLIGSNSGTLAGERDSSDSYYKYQIYNNGTVTGEDSTGGLIGSNEGKGSLTAAYNTGTVNGSTNVGGVVGTNAGAVDQVFNAVMTEGGQNQAVGKDNVGDNVGGIVGSNTGTVSNAYNKTEVKGNTNVGAIAGSNNGTISNVYGKFDLVADGTKVTEKNGGYVIDGDSRWTNRNSYGGFDFTKGTWKNYDGHTHPLLKVFLTKVTVEKPETLKELIASGKPLDVKQLIQDGILSAPKDANGYPGFSAYEGNLTLLQTVEHKGTGTYSDWFYSFQIESTGSGDTFNPNLLGYDIDFTASITDGEFNPDRWNYLFRDAPWGRQWNWRERKAEIHFMDGAFRY